MTVHTSNEVAERAVEAGDLDAALAGVQDQIRRNAADPKLRVFLFQLLCVRGEWERAQTQLKVAADLDAQAAPMSQMYAEAIRCEQFRGEVFAGRRSPLVLGEPEAWMALLIESLQARGQGRHDEAESLRARGFDLAQTSAGRLDEQPFAWIADADMRLGPVCEAIINGRYYWVPFARVSSIVIEPPADLRDLVWMPVHFTFTNQADVVGLIPTRYSGSESSSDARLRLGRRTEWQEVAPGVFHGLGQRMWTTDGSDHALMDLRRIDLDGRVDAAVGEAGA